MFAPPQNSYTNGITCSAGVKLLGAFLCIRRAACAARMRSPRPGTSIARPTAEGASTQRPPTSRDRTRPRSRLTGATIRNERPTASHTRAGAAPVRCSAASPWASHSMTPLDSPGGLLGCPGPLVQPEAAHLDGEVPGSGRDLELGVGSQGEPRQELHLDVGCRGLGADDPGPGDRDLGEHGHVLTDRTHARSSGVQSPERSLDWWIGAPRPASSSQPTSTGPASVGSTVTGSPGPTTGEALKSTVRADEGRRVRPFGHGRPRQGGVRVPGDRSPFGLGALRGRGVRFPGRWLSSHLESHLGSASDTHPGGECHVRTGSARPRRPAHCAARAGPPPGACSPGPRPGQRRRRRGPATARPPRRGAVARRQQGRRATSAARSRDRPDTSTSAAARSSTDPSATTRPFTPSSTSSAGP